MKFDNDVPIPESKSRSKWAHMTVGQSVFLEGKSYKHAYNIVSGLKRRLGFKFAVRTVDGGVRIWRTD